jgi:hypothetical protein
MFVEVNKPSINKDAQDAHHYLEQDTATSQTKWITY